VICEVLTLSNSMVGESALPDFTSTPSSLSERMRVSALDQLNGVFEGYIDCRREEKMNMLWHYDEGVNFKASFATVAIHCLKQGAHVVFYNEQFSAMPCRKSYEISSGRRDESSMLQEHTSAAKSAIFA